MSLPKAPTHLSSETRSSVILEHNAAADKPCRLVHKLTEETEIVVRLIRNIRIFTERRLKETKVIAPNFRLICLKSNSRKMSMLFFRKYTG